MKTPLTLSRSQSVPRSQAMHGKQADGILKPLQRIAAEGARTQSLAQLRAIANPQRGGEGARGGLPERLRSGIEGLSGIAMDDVRVHYNSDKPAQLQAHAFAQGSDIHIAPGQERHLAHEAWHVVQQRQGRVKPTLQLKGTAINDDTGLEREADVMGAKALHAEGTHIAQRHVDLGGASESPAQLVRVSDSADGKETETEDLLNEEGPEALVALALRFYSLHNMSELAKIQQAHAGDRRLTGYDISDGALAVMAGAKVIKSAVVKESGAASSSAAAASDKSGAAKESAAAASGKSAAASAKEKAKPAEEESDADDEVYYQNETGQILTEAQYEGLQDLIRAYDVPLDQDFSRGSAKGQMDPLIQINTGLFALEDFINSRQNRGLKQMLDYVIHPGCKDHSRNVKYKGRSFMQILGMCRQGNECHNDLAEALRECLGTLKRDG